MTRGKSVKCNNCGNQKDGWLNDGWYRVESYQASWDSMSSINTVDHDYCCIGCLLEAIQRISEAIKRSGGA